MGRNSYQTCLKIVESLRNAGYEKEATISLVVEHIEMVAGFDTRVKRKYLQLLRKWGFVKNKSNKVFELCA